MKDKPAKREDWKTEPFPEATVNLALERIYSTAEFAQIAQGCVPQQMEDKWFIFYEAPWLFLHRSWTGYCIYQVRFEPVAEGCVLQKFAPTATLLNIRSERRLAIAQIWLYSSTAGRARMSGRPCLIISALSTANQTGRIKRARFPPHILLRGHVPSGNVWCPRRRTLGRRPHSEGL
jgi:hypothetical protein